MALSELLAGKPPEERDMIMSLVNTGQNESVTEPGELQRMLIERENADLADPAKPDPIVNSYDLHDEHITGHSASLADPELRRDPVMVQRVMKHCQAHKDALSPWATGFAGHETLLLTGQKALPPPPPTGPQALTPPGPNGTAQPPQGGPPGPGVAPDKGPPPGEGPIGNAAKAKAGASPMPSMPKPPVNPATGERMPIEVPGAPQV
jgi:hypothetical protein